MNNIFVLVQYVAWNVRDMLILKMYSLCTWDSKLTGPSVFLHSKFSNSTSDMWNSLREVQGWKSREWPVVRHSWSLSIWGMREWKSYGDTAGEGMRPDQRALEWPWLVKEGYDVMMGTYAQKWETISFTKNRVYINFLWT